MQEQSKKTQNSQMTYVYGAPTDDESSSMRKISTYQHDRSYERPNDIIETTREEHLKTILKGFEANFENLTNTIQDLKDQNRDLADKIEGLEQKVNTLKQQPGQGQIRKNSHDSEEEEQERHKAQNIPAGYFNQATSAAVKFAKAHYKEAILGTLCLSLASKFASKYGAQIQAYMPSSLRRA